MVIYLRTFKNIFLKFSIFISLFLFVSLGGYLLTFLRYDNYDVINTEVLVLENQNLKKELIGLKSVSELSNYDIGKVIYRDIHNFYNEIVIYVKKLDVCVGEAVINEKGLVGIIYKIENNKAYVKLLSSDYNVSVKVGNTYGNLNNGKITLLDKYSEIKIGDLVYTSGLNDIPEDIYVGKIVDVAMDSENLGKKVKVELINNDDLNYVGIVGNIK